MSYSNKRKEDVIPQIRESIIVLERILEIKDFIMLENYIFTMIIKKIRDSNLKIKELIEKYKSNGTKETLSDELVKIERLIKAKKRITLNDSF